MNHFNQNLSIHWIMHFILNSKLYINSNYDHFNVIYDSCYRSLLALELTFNARNISFSSNKFRKVQDVWLSKLPANALFQFTVYIATILFHCIVIYCFRSLYF